MNTNCIVAMLTIVLAILVGKLWFLPWLWEPGTTPDPRQDECLPGGSELNKHDTTTDSGVVRTIQLTDDGEFVNRCQLTDAIYEIRNCPEPELIVWYIHG
jgi:hypothetical protein